MNSSRVRVRVAVHRGGSATLSSLGVRGLGAPGLALALSVLALALGCTRDAGAGDLDARARQYMELRQKGDWEKIYDDLLDPELKVKLERDKFLQRRKSTFDILEFQVDAKQAEAGGTEATVVARIEAMMPIRKPGGAVMSIRRQVQDQQDWVQRDGGWYIRLVG
jgi:hypothetical protein